MVKASRPSAIVRTFLTDMPAMTTTAGLTLASRRSAALTDLFRSVAEVRLPSELIAVQLGYWTQLIDDYQDAFAEGLTQLTAPAPAARAKAPSAAAASGAA